MQCWEYGRFVPGALTWRWKDGAPVSVVKQQDTERSVAGYTDSTYRVRVGGRETEVWGGELANAGCALSNGQRLLVRVVGTGPGKLRQMEARIHPGSAVVRFAPIEVQDSDRFAYSLGVLASDGRGLSGVERLFRVKFTYGACDYPNGEVVLLQRGPQLIVGPRIVSGSGETSEHTYRLLFPRDAGGRRNHIREVSTLTERNARGAVVRQRTRITNHRWTGSRMVE